MASVKLEDIRYEKPDGRSCEGGGQPMLVGEIPGAEVSFYKIKSGEKRFFPGEKDKITILFLCFGGAEFKSGDVTASYSERAVYTDMPESDISVSALSDCELLKIKWTLDADDTRELETKKDRFPFTEKYSDALQYRDPFKSESTISRAIIVHDFIPRFAMGSVEAKGDDLVGQHAHPLLDQFFFSFPENDADLLIDCRIFALKGNTLVHIPLGSNHGVIARGDQRMHYLWLDFTPASEKDDAVAYLNEVHKPTGLKEELK